MDPKQDSAKYLEHLDKTIQSSFKAKQHFYEKNRDQVIEAARWMGETVRAGGKMVIFGNGGSAADAQHMAAEMVGRMLVERKKPLPALALTTDTSALTAIGNDYSYEDVFELQVRALARKGDLAIAISTSGNSKNVVKAVRAAREMGVRVLSMTGGSGGMLRELSDLSLNVELGQNSSMIQETHITIIHLLVDLMDRFFLDENYVRLK
ncbi:MAG TPA: D-sedoheptulose 7-phosphate isomerase [Oligoflexia bacterium]|mgnify:CR=1 FL=1|nr:D-sedoheptulose 7-phosphate isomerase [Oligoflexia bacterium]